MNYKSAKIITLLFVIFSQFSFAQRSASKFKNFEGDKTLSFLANDSIINLQFYYGKLIVQWKEGPLTVDKEESVFLKETSDRLNAIELGKGDKWKENWFTYRKEHFEPEFITNLTKALTKGESRLQITNEKGPQKYTLLVYTFIMNPGWNVGITYSTPICHYQIIFCETVSRKVLASWSFFVQNWEQNNFTASKEFSEHTQNMLLCYKYAGSAVGKYVANKTKK